MDGASLGGPRPPSCNVRIGGFQTWSRIGIALEFFFPWALLWFGSMFLSSLRSHRYCLALPGEEKIPFVPWMMPWYLSLDLAVPLVIFLAPDLNTLRRVYRSMLLQTLVASCVYVIVPQTLCFDGHERGGVWENLANHTGTTNLGWHADAPSLHVSFAFTLAWILAPAWRSAFRWRIGLAVWIWAVGVALSTVLVHEHHLMDVVTGIGLAMVFCWWKGPLERL